jgi:ABC-type branched-subunit amino acid transport system ATPase component
VNERMSTAVMAQDEAFRGDANDADPWVLRATGVQKSFDGNTVLRNVSLELRRGEVVVLRGDNGSGKTTLLNILTGSLEPDQGLIRLCANGTSECFRFPRKWWHDINPLDHFTPERMAAEAVGRTWQDVRLFGGQDLVENVALATPHQIGENPATVLLNYKRVVSCDHKNRQAARSLLERLELGTRSASSPAAISLGQSKRVAIARAIQAGARILFLDEPLAGLDEPGIGQVVALLQDLVATGELTLVIVEHVFHIPRILSFATRVWTLSHGEVLSETPECVSRELMEGARDEDTLEWLNRTAGPNGTVRTVALPGGASLSIVSTPKEEDTIPILDIAGVEVRRGDRVVIGSGTKDSDGGLSLSLRAGELAVLHAPNGWGKTTLLETIAGLLTPSSGQIKFDGRCLASANIWERSRLGVRLVRAQDQLFPNLTVAENLTLSRAVQHDSKIDGLLDRRMSALSGGERQQVALAGALGGSTPRLLLLDEPFGMLDLQAIRHFRTLLKPSANLAILIALPSALAFRKDTK